MRDLSTEPTVASASGRPYREGIRRKRPYRPALADGAWAAVRFDCAAIDGAACRLCPPRPIFPTASRPSEPMTRRRRADAARARPVGAFAPVSPVR